MKSKKKHYSYPQWGKCIHTLRTELGISIHTLCADCNISARTYYEVLNGQTPT